jgi:hypothetical protein
VVDVPVGRLLLGLQNQVRADDFAAELGDPMWPSTPVARGPHAQLLRLADETAELSDEAILSSPYADFARVCIRLRGFYFNATDDAGIVLVARNFIARHRGEVVAALGGHQSAAGSPIRVAPIRWSDAYQVLDGHHRVASAIVAGTDSLPARVKWIPVTTPLQRLLLRGSPGGRRLSQPLPAPELESWAVEEGGAALAGRARRTVGIIVGHAGRAGGAFSALDLASGYGAPVAEMVAAGVACKGVEPDPDRVAVGRVALGLPDDRLHVAEPTHFLAAANRTWEVVTCFDPERLATMVEASRLVHLLEARAERAVVLDGRTAAGTAAALSLSELLQVSGTFSLLQTHEAAREWSGAGDGPLVLVRRAS